MPKQKEFIVRGRMTLDGVSFFVMAKDGQEAVEKAKAGEWVSTETDGADMVDWSVNDEAEPNE